jgi:hypothetical protein
MFSKSQQNRARQQGDFSDVGSDVGPPLLAAFGLQADSDVQQSQQNRARQQADFSDVGPHSSRRSAFRPTFFPSGSRLH